jgi:hypothetical protein
MQSTDPNYRVAYGAQEASALISSLFSRPIPDPGRAYGISNLDMLEVRFPNFIASFANFDRLEAKVPSRFIYTSARGPFISGSDDLFMRRSKYLSPGQLAGCEDLTIVGDTVVFMTDTGTDVIAEAITSPTIAKQMISFFNFLWAFAE